METETVTDSPAQLVAEVAVAFHTVEQAHCNNSQVVEVAVDHRCRSAGVLIDGYMYYRKAAKEVVVDMTAALFVGTVVVVVAVGVSVAAGMARAMNIPQES